MSKKYFSILGTAFAAFALTFTMVSCSQEEANLVEETPTKGTSTVYVSVPVQAVSNATRTAVTTSGSDHALKFTSGDKLFVRAALEIDEKYILIGVLNIKDGSIAADGKSASFEGSLDVKERKTTHKSDEWGNEWDEDEFIASTYEFTTDNPLEELVYPALAQLIAEGRSYHINDGDSWLSFDNDSQFAATADELLETAIDIQGWFNPDEKKFSISHSNDCIFDITITGLDNADYQVDFIQTDGNVASFEGLKAIDDESRDPESPYFVVVPEKSGNVTVSSGKASFAITWNPYMLAPYTIGLRLMNLNDNTVKIIRLGYAVEGEDESAHSPFESRQIYKLTKAVE